MFRHVSRGLKDAARQPKLLLLLWAWSGLLGLMAAWPAYRWWARATEFSPQADVLAERLHIATLLQLAQYDRTNPWALVTAGAFMVLVVALLTSPLLAGGVFETLDTAGNREPRRLFHRFFRGAGSFYWRFLALLVLTIIVVLLAMGLAMAVLYPLLSPLRDSEWEPAGWVRILIIMVAGGFLVLTGLMVLDFARIRLVRGDSPGVFSAWFRALWIVLRHPIRSYGIWVLMGVLLVVLVVVYSTLRNVIPSSSAGLIALMVLMQQAFILSRAGLRVATVGAELDAYRCWFPGVAPGEPVAPRPVATTHPPIAEHELEMMPGPAGHGPDYSI